VIQVVVFSEKHLRPLLVLLTKTSIDCYLGLPINWGEARIKVSSYLTLRGFEKTPVKALECDYDGVLLTNLLNRLEPPDNKKCLWFLHQTGQPRPHLYYSEIPKKFGSI